MHNTAVGAPSANNLVMVILNGVQRRVGHHDAYMPGFRNLSDAQVVTLVNYVEQQFGDPAVRIATDQVASFRQNLGPSPPYWAIAIGIIIGLIMLVAIIVFLLRGRHRRQPAT